MRNLSIILVIDAETLSPLGMMSSDWFTDFRTAAGLAAATKALAAANARTLTVYGAGKLAEPTVRLLCRVRDFDRVLLVGRTRSRLEALTARLRGDPGLAGIDFDDTVGPDEAAAEADVIATVTNATAPVFDGARVRPGTHVNIAGAYRPEWREIDDALAGRAVFYMDSASACLSRSGDIRIPLDSGVLSADRLRGEIGALFEGSIPGRCDGAEITVFKSLGNAVQDLYLGGRLLAEAGEAGILVRLDT